MYIVAAIPNRRMQVTANRLQLGKCRLNHYVHTMGNTTEDYVTYVMCKKL